MGLRTDNFIWKTICKWYQRNRKEYAEVSVYQRITENNSIITDFWTDSLMELILRKDNLNKAYKKVKSNKGKGGIDGMQVDELLPYLKRKPKRNNPKDTRREIQTQSGPQGRNTQRRKRQGQEFRDTDSSRPGHPTSSHTRTDPTV